MISRTEVILFLFICSLMSYIIGLSVGFFVGPFPSAVVAFGWIAFVLRRVLPEDKDYRPTYTFTPGSYVTEQIADKRLLMRVKIAGFFILFFTPGCLGATLVP